MVTFGVHMQNFRSDQSLLTIDGLEYHFWSMFGLGCCPYD